MEKGYLKLTEQEERLFNWITNIVSEEQTGTVVRVAGGWVRDKLLNKDAHDIDISVDNISGQQFGELLKSKAPSRINSKQKTTESKVAVISIRPDEGKFVETATIHVFEYSLDLLSLRSQEQIGEHSDSQHNLNDSSLSSELISRLKASEDAHLRDFTINSLFYNVQTRTIEDYTNGLRHLREKVLRCPEKFSRELTLRREEQGQSSYPDNEQRELEGTESRLHEDPLRSLRAIRFSYQLDFQMSPVLRHVINSPVVRMGLLEKSKNERIETELLKIFSLSTEKALKGLKTLVEFQLLDSVFPVASTKSTTFWREFPRLSDCVACLDLGVFQREQEALDWVPLSSQEHSLVFGSSEQAVSVLSLFFAPLWDDYIYEGNQAIHTMPFTRIHMKDHWKYSVKFSSDVFGIIENAYELLSLLHLGWSDTAKVKIGLMIRTLQEKWWITWIVVRSLLELSHKKTPLTVQPALLMKTLWNNIIQAGFFETNARYGSISPLFTLKPLFTGKDFINFGVKPGPGMGVLVEALLEWQLLNMDKTRSDCESWLKQHLLNK